MLIRRKSLTKVSIELKKSTGITIPLIYLIENFPGPTLTIVTTANTTSSTTNTNDSTETATTIFNEPGQPITSSTQIVQSKCTGKSDFQ